MRIIRNQSKNRKRDILDKVVSCYLEKGEPIASEFLVMRYHLDVSPATVRNEFQELGREGYLYKCHISSGRIPTDKALKAFIENIFEKGEIEIWKQKWFEKMKEKIRTVRDLEKLIDFLANETRAFSFFYFPDKEIVIKKGMKYLFSLLDKEWEEVNYNLIERLAESIENFDEQIKNIRAQQWPLIYVGKENPIIKVENLSFIINHARSRPLVFGILGNKRMPYDKNLGLLEAMAEIF